MTTDNEDRRILPDSVRAARYFYWSARVNGQGRLRSLASALDGWVSVWVCNRADAMAGMA